MLSAGTRLGRLRLLHGDGARRRETAPLRAARFTRLTDWEGSEVDAALSSDGAFVAFLSDRDGPVDAWVTPVGGNARPFLQGATSVAWSPERREILFDRYRENSDVVLIDRTLR